MQIYISQVKNYIYTCRKKTLQFVFTLSVSHKLVSLIEKSNNIL